MKIYFIIFGEKVLDFGSLRSPKRDTRARPSLWRILKKLKPVFN
jgi:hypothetical protein